MAIRKDSAAGGGVSTANPFASNTMAIHPKSYFEMLNAQRAQLDTQTRTNKSITDSALIRAQDAKRAAFLATEDASLGMGGTKGLASDGNGGFIRPPVVTAKAGLQADGSTFNPNLVTSPKPTDANKYVYDGDSADTMADREFKPQYDLLAKMRKNATTNYDHAGNAIGGMYNQLASSIRGEAPAIKQEYKSTGDSIGNNYNKAISTTKSDHQQSQNETSALARRLGVSEAMPESLQESNNQKNMLTGLMSANKNNQTSLNSQLGTNENSYNRSEANTSDQAGINAKSDFKQRLAVAQQGFDNQNLQIQSQEGQARNRYGMDIRKMTLEGQGNLNESQANVFKQKAVDDNNAAVNRTAQDRLILDRDKYERPINSANGGQNNPYQTLAQSSMQSYGGNEQEAQNAQMIVEDAFQKAGADRNMTLPAFLAFLNNDYAGERGSLAGDMSTRGDTRQLNQLASMFWNNMANSSKGQ